MMIRHFLAFLLPLAFVLTAQAQEPTEEPWGYVYVFRTLRVYPLAGKDNRMGRLPENQIALTSPKVSRRHATIRLSDEGVEFLDIGSSNGSRWNGASVRANSPVMLRPGDRIQLADELLLYHTSLAGLWEEEVRLRLLTSLVKLNVHLPQDVTRMSFGRERLEPAVTEAILRPDSGDTEIKHSVPVEPDKGFPEGSPAFVGHVSLEDGVLELSLWGIAAGDSMTSRRSSIARLKHTTLRVALEEGSTDGGHQNTGPWFPPHYLSDLFDHYSEDRDTSLRFATSLARQERPEALRDAAETLWFRHHLRPSEWKLLVQAAESRARWIDEVVSSKRMSLTEMDIDALTKELEGGQAWIEEARQLGADESAVERASAAIVQAARKLVAVRDSK